MKVENKTSVDPKVLQNAAASKGTKDVSKDLSVSKDSSKVSKKDAATATAVADGAKVSLSAKAQDFKKIKEAATKSGDVNEAKVASVKQAIKDGKYNINYDKIADKMIENDIMLGA